MRVVIAIDFGTSRSGYALAFTDEKEVYPFLNWPGQPMPYPKTLTQMLYGPSNDLIAWGYEAPRELAKHRRDPDIERYHLFRNFKMQLHHGRPSAKGPVFSENGQSYQVVDLIANYLEKIKEFALRQLQGGGSGLLRNEDIRWCLTVPAIWTDANKQHMRQAAQRAGLIGTASAEAERLVLVLEPEAAALYCQEKDEEFSRERLKPGVTFMVVDAGGGTVDLTVHEVNDDGELREMVRGSGGACGSTYIDQQFQDHLETVLGSYVLGRFREDDPIGFMRLMEDWERSKCDYQGTETDDLLLEMPRKLGKILEELEYCHVLRKLADAQDGDEDNIHLSPETMNAIFRPVLDDIVRLIRTQFQELGEQKCDYLFLVGGFAASRVLQQRIRREFAGKVRKLVIPMNPGAAVVSGAVLFGLDEGKIRSRRTRLTYGCGIEDIFEPGKDPEKKKIWREAKSLHYCQDRFSTFVKSSDLVDIDKKITRTYYPVIRNQVSMSLAFYSSAKREVRFVDEEGVSRLGEVIVDMPNTAGDMNRAVEVTMYFGRTEIQVKARDVTSGSQVSTTLRFS